MDKRQAVDGVVEPAQKFGTFLGVFTPSVLTILGLISRHGHLCVCEVERILGISQSKASRHLRYMRDAGILEDERDGLIMNYHLPTGHDQELDAIMATLRDLLASRPLPEAEPLLKEIRVARAESRESPEG